jgi:hypothetical protein
MEVVISFIGEGVSLVIFYLYEKILALYKLFFVLIRNENAYL